MEHTPEQWDTPGQTNPIDDIFSHGGAMGLLMQKINWASTPLGPAETWPQSLRTALSICLNSHFPMLIWWGPALVMLYNDAYRPTLGSLKHPHSMGQRGSECWPEIWDVIGPMLEGVLTRGEATWSHNQLLLLERDGYPEECYFTFSYSPIRDESGGIGGVFTAVTETTPQVLGERRLRILRELAAASSEARTAEDACRIAIETIRHNSEDIPFALLYLLDANAQQLSLAGTTGVSSGTLASPLSVNLSAPENACSWPFAEVVTKRTMVRVGDVQALFPSLKLTSLVGSSLRTALLLPVMKSGQESLYGILIAGVSPLRALDAEYAGYFELVAGQVATNIADARAYEEERARAEALAELDRAKTTFFSNISHEFRTPLTLLLGPIEDALAQTDETFTPQHYEALQIVQRNARRLLKLVNTLLDFLRIEAGRSEAVYEATDLATFTNELASMFRSLVETAGLRYVVDCQPLSEPAYVACDLWEKIVFNLLSNAFKSTLTGEITVTLRQVGNTVEFSVQDTGVGIAAKSLPRIFERFHRVRGVQARSFEGSGIGLSLVQELVHLHGGTITATSAVGQGSTFTVTLPLGTAHLPQDRIGGAGRYSSTMLDATIFLEEAQRWLLTTVQPTALLDVPDVPGEKLEVPAPLASASAPVKAHILLVDGNADMRDYLAHLLQENYSVDVAADGAQALAMVRAHQPDLVLSDVMMPVLDGFQLVQALRADPETRTIPLILLSARAGEASAIEGLQAGADDYLVKPFSARELLARVSTRLEMAKMRLALAHQAEEYAQRLQQLARTALAINAIRPIEELLSLVTRHAREIIGAHLAMTGLETDVNRRRAYAMASYSDKYAAWREQECACDLSGIAAYLQRMQTPVRLAQDALESLPERDVLERDRRTHPAFNGLLAVPLQGRDQRISGLLVLSDKAEGDFTADDEAILVQLAQMTAIAVENNHLYQQSQAAIKARDHLLSMVSHDLKNPLGAIKGYAQLLQRVLARRDMGEDEQVSMFLTRINTTVNKMTAQVSELLDIAHLQLGQPIELMTEEVDLVALVTQVVAEQQATTRHHTLRLGTTRATLPIVLDGPRIERVLANLLSNAMKYAPDAQEVDIHIDWKAGESGDYALVSVHDYGIGIPEADLPHIFEQFHRASNVVGTFEGTGIGLANAYQIVAYHDGTITVQSKEGEGSIFTICLPLGLPQNSPDRLN